MKATNKATPIKLAVSRSDSVAYSRTFDYHTAFNLGDKVIWFILKLPDRVPNRYKPAARGELIGKKLGFCQLNRDMLYPLLSPFAPDNLV